MSYAIELTYLSALSLSPPTSTTCISDLLGLFAISALDAVTPLVSWKSSPRCPTAQLDVVDRPLSKVSNAPWLSCQTDASLLKASAAARLKRLHWRAAVTARLSASMAAIKSALRGRFVSRPPGVSFCGGGSSLEGTSNVVTGLACGVGHERPACRKVSATMAAVLLAADAAAGERAFLVVAMAASGGG